jgi:hypothetical protein
VAVMGCPKKGVQSPTPIGGLDFLDMDSLLKYPEIRVLDFLDTLLARASMGLRKLTGAAFVRASRLENMS